MTANYVLLERITVGEAGAASVTFNNIPQSGYTDLKIVVSARSVRALALDDFKININNGGAGSNMSSRALQGDGSSASSWTDTFLGFIDGNTATLNTFGNLEIYIPNYRSSTAKSISTDSVTENNGTSSWATINAALWNPSPQAAITSIGFSSTGGNFLQYSTFSLYGLAAVGTTPVIAPYASGGDIIETDGTYWYHAFLSSGTFTPAKALSCDVLVVAGGGAADGNSRAGGGGAGGVLVASANSLTANTAYTTIVGAGGSAGDAGTTAPTNGANSVFNSNTAIGGGAGGLYRDPAYNGSNGGSGGGGSAGAFNGQGLGGSPTSGQGYAGGNSINRTGGTAGGWTAGGGGGGAGSVGTNASGNGQAGTTNTPGNGGVGINSISWSGGTLSTALSTLGLGLSGYLAGGGAATGISSGGSNLYGTAGSGNGGNNTTAPTPNTGGGGSCGNASKGASGLIILRYAI